MATKSTCLVAAPMSAEIINMLTRNQRKSRTGWAYTYETRVGACADYLLGKKLAQISHTWGVPDTLIVHWIRQRRCFKLRNRRRNATSRLRM
jgi:transposase-like protein